MAGISRRFRGRALRPLAGAQLFLRLAEEVRRCEIHAKTIPVVANVRCSEQHRPLVDPAANMDGSIMIPTCLTCPSCPSRPSPPPSERELDRQLNLTRIADALPQEPVEVE